MVVLIKKLANYPRKSNPNLDLTDSIALQSFKSNLSNDLTRLFSDPSHASGSLSLSWFIPCFKFIQGTNRAFPKLVKDLNHPVNKWEGNLVENYLSYSLNILDILNSISSSISHLGVSRLSLSHALSLIPNSPSLAVKHLKPIVPRKIEVFNCQESRFKSINLGKKGMIYEAMETVRDVNLLILRVLLCGLCGENGNLGFLLGCGEELEGFELGFVDNLEIKEIKEVNEAVKEVEGGLVVEKKSSENGAAEELKRKLDEMERLLEMAGKEVNCLFSEVLAGRSKLIDCLRLPKSKYKL